MRQREIKKLWLDALESGEYEQTRSTLYDPRSKGFCCLGVLQHCLLDGEVEFVENSTDIYETVPTEWFYDKFPQLGWVKQKEATLAERNDDGNSFKEIAAYIRSEWKVS